MPMPPASSAASPVTIGGMGTAPVRARELEQALLGQVPTKELFRDACESCRKLEAIDDVHAPASYRQHLAAVLSRRALERRMRASPAPTRLRRGRIRDYSMGETRKIALTVNGKRGTRKRSRFATRSRTSCAISSDSPAPISAASMGSAAPAPSCSTGAWRAHA